MVFSLYTKTAKRKPEQTFCYHYKRYHYQFIQPHMLVPISLTQFPSKEHFISQRVHSQVYRKNLITYILRKVKPKNITNKTWFFAMGNIPSRSMWGLPANVILGSGPQKEPLWDQFCRFGWSVYQLKTWSVFYKEHVEVFTDRWALYHGPTENGVKKCLGALPSEKGGGPIRFEGERWSLGYMLPSIILTTIKILWISMQELFDGLVFCFLRDNFHRQP